MTCEWMERVAVAIDDEWTPEVEAHVGACAECRELLADRALLREAPEIGPEVYAAVRAQVLERVRPSYAMWWRAAAAIVVAVIGMAWWMTRLPAVERLEVAVSAPAAPVVERVAVVKKAAVRRARRVRKHDPVKLALALREQLDPAPAKLAGGVAFAMHTEDPNVVILLVPGGDE